MSRKTSFDDIVGALPHLTPEQRGQIKGLCNLTGSSASVPNKGPRKDLDENLTLFYGELRSALRERGTKLPRSVTSLGPDMTRIVTEGWEAADAYVDLSFPSKLSRANLQKFYIITIGIVIDYLLELDHPVGVKTVSQHMKNCAGLINRQFPGYQQSGLMPLMLKWGQRNSELDIED